MEFRQVLPNRTEPTTRSNEQKMGHNALTFTKLRAEGRQNGGGERVAAKLKLRVVVGEEVAKTGRALWAYSLSSK